MLSTAMLDNGSRLWVHLLDFNHRVSRDASPQIRSALTLPNLRSYQAYSEARQQIIRFADSVRFSVLQFQQVHLGPSYRTRFQ